MDRQPYLKTLGRSNILVLIVVAGALALFASFIRDLAARQDAQAENQAISFVETLLLDRSRAIESMIVNYANSGSGYANLHLTVDYSWAYIQDNLGRSLFTNMGLDYIAVFDAEDGVRYSLIDGKLVFGQKVASLQGGVQKLVEKARSLGEFSVVSGLLVDPDGFPILASAAVLSPGADHTVQRDGRVPPVLLFGDRLSPAQMSDIQQEMIVTDLQFRRRDWPTGVGEERWFPTFDGLRHFALHLKAPTPGRDMLSALAPGAAALVLVLFGALLLVALQGRRIAAMNRRNEEAMAQARQRAEHLALHDLLTGLPNRLYLSRCCEEIARTELDGVAVLCLDLDQFKPINDRHGHAAGDMVLAAVASRLRGAIRPGEVATRIGGDEFVLLVRLTDEEAIDAFCRGLIAAIRRPILFEGRKLLVGVSIGIAILQTSESVEAAVRRADTALYEAKRTGRGRFELADERNRPALARTA